MADIVLPTAKAMVSEGTPFRGVLFAGLMIKNGKVCASSLVCCGVAVGWCAGSLTCSLVNSFEHSVRCVP
jgi:hypothetical protein